jgi:hypothetical protein
VISVCRLFFAVSHHQNRGHPELLTDTLPMVRSKDHELGHALTHVQLGEWQSATKLLAALNEFYTVQYAHAEEQRSVPQDHDQGKALLVLEEWMNALMQLNRCASPFSTAAHAAVEQWARPRLCSLNFWHGTPR